VNALLSEGGVDDIQRPGVVSEDETKITLGLLNAVEANSALTQRSMASELGIALGLANAYLKRCVRKGLIKVKQVPANRYAYYLTPMGFAEKSRLTADYLTISFNFFRGAREQCTAILDHCDAQGWRRIALAGASDLSEIAVLCAQDHAVEIAGIVDDQINRPTFAGLPVARRLKDLGAVNAVMICDTLNQQAVFDAFVESMARERVFTPPLLGVSRAKPTLAE
jgi:DNA-binding MarR family transcriptional regulator